MNKFKPELRHFGLDISRPLTKELLNTDYLHYGYWTEGLEVNFSNIRQAQENYVDMLLKHIPAETQKILDVGSGTGEVSKTLTSKGFRMDCVSPSEQLNEIARQKLGSQSKVTTAGFEDFRSPEKYDLVMFSESFQYIPFVKALENAANHLKDGGHVLVADFFRHERDGKPPISGGHSMKKFYDYLPASQFEVVSDIDITDFVSPTIDLRQRFFSNIIIPCGKAIHGYMSARRPLLLKVILFLLRKKLVKFQNKYINQTCDSKVFKHFKSYRLFLLKKKSA